MEDQTARNTARLDQARADAIEIMRGAEACIAIGWKFEEDGTPRVKASIWLPDRALELLGSEPPPTPESIAELVRDVASRSTYET